MEKIKEKIKNLYSKARTWLRKIISKISNGVSEIVKNPQWIPVICFGINSAVKICRSMNRIASRRHDEKMLGKTFYDPVLGSRLYTKRRLSQKEMREMSYRRKRGDYVTDILCDMGVVKAPRFSYL